jgi:hypothetical protein
MPRISERRQEANALLEAYIINILAKLEAESFHKDSDDSSDSSGTDSSSSSSSDTSLVMP